MTLHNFRLMFSKIGILKEKKYEKYGLYKNSHFKTYIIFKMFNKNINLLNNVDTFIALNNFAKEEFISIGIPQEKIKVKPNFIPEKKFGQKTLLPKKKNYFICTSRLSNEKGVDTLIKCWDNIDYELKLFGEGPLANDINNKKISYYGKKNFEEITSHLQNSIALILPSKLNEGGLPLSILEAFKNEVLVIASNLGSMKSEIKDKVNHYKLSKFNYDIFKKELVGEGILVTTNYKLPNSDKYFFDTGFFNLKKDEFVAQNIKILLQPLIFGEKDNNPRIKGVSSSSKNGVTTINKGIFTSCNIDNDCTPWYISASKITHDKNKKQLTYDDAVLRIYNTSCLFS